VKKRRQGNARPGQRVPQTKTKRVVAHARICASGTFAKR